MAYSSVEDAAHLMHFLGPGCLMAKLDIKEAYRIVPIHPDDRRSLGVYWRGQVWIDCQLPFGLASALAIFSALVEALEWVHRQKGVRAMIHYLDDFLLLGAPGSGECQQYLSVTLQVCQELGVPVAPEKTEGPALSLTFLGIQLDSVAMCTSLPAEKLERLRTMVESVRRAKVIRDVHAFNFLPGHLVHAATVCPIDRAFLNHLFFLKVTLRPGQLRRINQEASAELAWWALLLDKWTGISFQQFIVLRQPDHQPFCDASGSWGCGAWAPPLWFQFPLLSSTPHRGSSRRLGWALGGQAGSVPLR